ncbi:MAG: SOS response-associated peptidase [SAR202 cluster bacterium]|jgi:putative SOS response-associated peptidase YedK|nr:SOS response-associated peptidase [SAR202 cluster bacterium]MDP6512208.1 SOS response-associated peptidase [SAR202 cluster bacterium]MDP6713930.1 SOS response-associated peptidase [SAR202 cluster bacterium]
MCGRFTLTADQDSFEDRFSFTGFDLGWVPSFNIAPTQEVLTITNRGSENRPELMRWGLVPSWAKDPKIGNRMINARAETLAEKPSFRNAFKRRRCLIPADGFYEWKREGKSKKPMRITANPGGLFAFAGLWETWKQPDDSWLLTCAIITTSANEFMTSIHDRMPVILPRESEALWLNSEEQNTAMLSELLLPYDSDEMEAYEVSTLVNSPRNNYPEVIAPVATLL